jgi:phospholipid/cholesterol/gamma-HCH transport system ATP-binding protein
MPDPIIAIKNLSTIIDGQMIHRDVNLSVLPGEILAIVGGSGAGKSTLLNCLLMLTPIHQGSVHILGYDLAALTPKQQAYLRTQCGVLFQTGGLFSALTVLENVCFPLVEHTAIHAAWREKIALLKITMAGLTEKDSSKYPAELSGGMIKRAAMARAIALDPMILFLDEPSAGLDPISASSLDQLILNLRACLNLTIVMVTHDLDSLAAVTDRIAFLGDGRVLACDTLEKLLSSDIPQVQAYFQNPRAKRTFVAEEYRAKNL